MATRPSASRAGIVVKLLALSLGCLVAALLCEVGARLVYPAPPEPLREPQILYQSTPDVGFLHVPSQTGWLDDGLATINRLGLRGAAPAMPKPAGSIRILAVGDSTTFGWGVNDDGTYPALLEKRMRTAFPGTPLDVVNGGVGAYDLTHDAKLLRHFAPMLTPDIVLVGLYWNDLPYESMDPDGPAPASRPPHAADPRAPSGSSPSKPFRIGNDPSRLNQILRRSRLLYVLRQTWLKSLGSSESATRLVGWETALLEGRQSGAIEAGWADIRETLQDIKSFADASQFAVGVVIIPIRAQVEGNYPKAQYQTRARAIAESLGMFVVDPLPLLQRQPDHASLFIPYDRMHLTATGNVQIAEAAFEALKTRAEFHP